MDRFVAFADVLGFRNIVRAKEHAKLTKIYDQMVINAETGASQGRWIVKDGTAQADTGTAAINMLVVSDSIVFWTDGVSAAEFTHLVLSAGKLLVAGFGNGLPLRVGIAVGDLTEYGIGYANPRLKAQAFFGKGLVDAYDIGEAQLWSGGVVTESAYAAYLHDLARSGQPELKSTSHLVDYPVPFERGPKDEIAINWTLFNRSGVPRPMVEKAFTIHHAELDQRAEVKRDNTLAFHQRFAA